MVQARPPLPHPDAGRATRRMPFEQLRALVITLTEPDPDPAPAPSDDDPAAEFEMRPTTCLPRTSTLDQLIAALPLHHARLARGSSAQLEAEPPPTDRGTAYMARRAPEPAQPPEPRHRTGSRALGGRGSHRR